MTKQLSAAPLALLLLAAGSPALAQSAEFQRYLARPVACSTRCEGAIGGALLPSRDQAQNAEQFARSVSDGRLEQIRDAYEKRKRADWYGMTMLRVSAVTFQLPLRQLPVIGAAIDKTQ